MKRQIIWVTVGLISLATLAFSWFIMNYEEVETERYENASREALRNPWLAMERFFVEMGSEVKTAHAATVLDNLPKRGMLVIDKMRQAYLTPARQDALLDWVNQGGYLIVVPERVGRSDAILEFFDVHNRPQKSKEKAARDLSSEKEPPASPFSEEAEGVDEANESDPIDFIDEDTDEDEVIHAANMGQDSRKAKPGSCNPAPDVLNVKIPGLERVFKVKPVYAYLRAGEFTPAWSAGRKSEENAFMHFTHGQGNITMISSFDSFFGNQRIAERDHAELLWALVEKYQPGESRQIVLLSQVPLPSLWNWLVESAWMALIAFVTLLLAWLWSVIPRFGVIEAPPLPMRRELGEHLSAIGRYVWRAGKLEEWLEIARKAFFNKLAVHSAHLFELPPQLLVARLAEKSKYPAETIYLSLYGHVKTIASFTQAVRTLRNLEQIL